MKKYDAKSKGVNWMCPILGSKTDTEIGNELGVSRERVRQVRSENGISKFKKERKILKSELLGTMPDYKLAKKLGTSRYIIRMSRISLGIPSYRPTKLTIEELNEIKDLLRQGAIQKHVAEKYNVCEMTISRIKTGTLRKGEDGIQ